MMPPDRPPGAAPTRRVLHVAAEGLPFSKTGGLADVIAALPAAQARLGLDVSVLVPAHAPPLEGAPRPRPTGRTFTVAIPEGDLAGRTFELLEAEAGGVRWWLLANAELFEREGLYVDPHGRDYPDNWLRYAAFARAAAEVAATLRADLVHCHDWQAALVPVYEAARGERGSTSRRFRSVLTIHNLAYQGLFPAGVYERLGLPARWFHVEGLEFYGRVNFLKGGIVAADALSTVSPTHAAEMLTREHGFGLEGVLRRRAGRLAGILNGVDYGEWDPRCDPFLVRRYGPDNLRGKLGCKLALQSQMGLARDLDIPLAGVVSRLVGQKGVDLLVGALPRLLDDGLQFVALGSGERRYEQALRELARAYPRRVGVRIGFDRPLAHQIEAGADLFPMPSRYEPCGLNQMYSLRYGTVPVVRATGGLADTVVDAAHAGRGTGFVFHAPTTEALAHALERALAVYGTPAWTELQRRGMAQDFSWEVAARRYVQLYGVVLGEAVRLADSAEPTPEGVSAEAAPARDDAASSPAEVAPARDDAAPSPAKVASLASPADEEPAGPAGSPARR